MESQVGGDSSLSPFSPTNCPEPGDEGGHPGGKVMFRRIGWQRPSPDERRWWLIQGALILGSVLALGTLVLLTLR